MAGDGQYEFVRERIKLGDRVRFMQDYYGCQYVEVRPRWLFWRKTLLRIAPEEAARIRSELRGRLAS